MNRRDEQNMEFENHKASGPLGGLRILELQGIGPGPLAATLLADLGADVVTILRPGGVTAGLDRPLEYDLLRRNRPRTTLNLKSDNDRSRFLALLERADVVIDPFRPGVTSLLGIGPETCIERNPRLIYACMTGWGRDGPLSKSAGHDINYMALTGALNAIGTAEAPLPPLNLAADMGGGAMFLVTGILAALLERTRSGQGQVVDASITDGTAYLALGFFGALASGNWSLERENNVLDGGAPYYRTYRTRDDKFVAVGAIEQKFFAILVDKLQLDPALFADRQNRDNWPEHHRLLAARFRAKTRDEWSRVFSDSDACVTPVLDFSEAPDHPHNRHRGVFFTDDGIPQPAPAPRFGRTPAGRPSRVPSEELSVEAAFRRWGLGDGGNENTSAAESAEPAAAPTAAYVNRDL